MQQPNKSEATIEFVTMESLPMGMRQLFMLITIAATTMMSTSAAIVDYRPGVKITNHVGGPITMQCASQDTDFGPRVLGNGEDMVWRFSANLWGSTLYWCNVDWQQRTAHVVVWKDANFWTGFGMPCIFCMWDIMPNGFYRTALEKANSRTFVQGWVYPPTLGVNDGLKESHMVPPVKGGDE